MEIDGQHGTSSDSSHGLEELSELMVELDARPLDVHLLKRQVEILRSLPMTEEFMECTNTLSSLVALEPDAWISYLDRLITHPQTLDTFLLAVEKFSQAEGDYLSSDLLHRHVAFIIECFESDQETGDPDLMGLLTPDYTRDLLREVMAKASGLLSDSSRIWNTWAEWEMRQLGASANQSGQLEILHEMYLDRLRCPHVDIEATAANYSTFCTAYCPNEYETRLVEATVAAQGAKAKIQSEKRHGATRQDYEDQLALNSDVTSRLTLLVSYIAWETDPKARPAGTKSGPTIDPILVQAVFERALAAYAEACSTAAKDSDRLAYKDAEGLIWVRYTNWLKSNRRPNEALATASRAVKACPEVAAVWTSLLLMMEMQGSTQDELLEAYNRAFALGPLTTRPSPTFVDVIIARAGMQARAEYLDTEGQLHPVLETVKQGVDLLQSTHKAGDPTLKLEKFVLEWAETKSPVNIELALSLIEKPIRARVASYQMTLLRASVEAQVTVSSLYYAVAVADLDRRRGAVVAARELYLTAIQRSDLDWPEAVYEAFAQFEGIHGTVETISQASRKIEKESEKLARRREKTAQTFASQPLAQVEVQRTSAPTDIEEVQQQPERETVPVNESENRVKRDREHTTVLVSGISKTTSRELVESFFESCGKIRETTIKSDDAWPTSTALLEFQTVDSVPAALAKDRRKIGDQEISVTMLWRSTLFITNFAPQTDDKQIRQLFGNYGTILDTRWPSLKYAGNRRFCYLTMDSPASAESARVLDGFKPDGDAKFGLKVVISDPSAKIKRSDAQDSVIFVGGLNAKSTEAEVKDLFKGHGQIQSIKMGWDSVKNICKGFAFVTMASEDDSKKAIKLHGTSHKGRLLKVELNDPNIANKKVSSDGAMRDKRARTVRLSDLPEGSQEALLQQALHKIVPVRRLELFAKTHHALAELETASDVGKLLLRSEPFLFNGTPVIITEHGHRPEPEKSSASKGSSGPSTSTPPSALSFAPRVAKRPGKTLGKGRHTAIAVVQGSPADGSGTTASQDAFRALVDSKNKQREGNLEASRGKRQHESGVGNSEDGLDAKKPKTE